MCPSFRLQISNKISEMKIFLERSLSPECSGTVSKSSRFGLSFLFEGIAVYIAVLEMYLYMYSCMIQIFLYTAVSYVDHLQSILVPLPEKRYPQSLKEKTSLKPKL